MKKATHLLALPICFLLMVSVISCSHKKAQELVLTIDYPAANTVFPPDLAAPTFTWMSDVNPVPTFQVAIRQGDVRLFESETTTETQWRPTPSLWEQIKKTSGKQLVFTVSNRETDVEASVSFSISSDSVAAPIFYRNVPLPFKFARENLKNVSWYLGRVSDEERPQTVLDNIPVCGNCHSFGRWQNLGDGCGCP